jgi:hypothetical protein
MCVHQYLARELKQHYPILPCLGRLFALCTKHSRGKATCKEFDSSMTVIIQSDLNTEILLNRLRHTLV